jgi:hypothetical protein
MIDPFQVGKGGKESRNDTDEIDSVTKIILG